MNILGFDIYLRSPERLISLDDYARVASSKLPRMVRAYVDGGANGEHTLRGNREALDRVALLPQVLGGHGAPNLKTTVAGVDLELPVLLAPTGFTGLAHWRGDLDAAAAAENQGTRYVLSTASSWSLEDVAKNSREDHFFQLYPHTGEVAVGLLKRAQAAGYRCLMLTVDVPVRGNRLGERKEGMGIPPILTPRRLLNIARYPRWAYDVVRHRRIGGGNLVEGRSVSAAIESIEIQERELMLDTLSWDDVAWIRDAWDGPMFIKGIARPEDALRAVELGVDGIVVSNHGGRQLDTMPATIDLLPAVAAAVAGKAEVIVDGGFRTGTDVVKALALGAKAVMIGRPYVHGLAVSRQRGVEEVLSILRQEISDAMSLVGAKDTASINASHIFTQTSS